MKRIKYQIIESDTRGVRAIPGLDLKKAFDTFSHAHILASISELCLGQNFHAFISSFLRHRKATLRIADFRSEHIELGTRGTPQRSVVSPLQLNIAMCKLSHRLLEVKGINHTLYAGNITVWRVGGCEGRGEEALQEALYRTETFLAGTGLRLSASKSELLLYRPSRRGVKHKGWVPLSEVNIALRTSEGHPIPRVAVILVLGMLIESNGCDRRTIANITAKTDSMIRVITRVSNSRGGINEDNLLRLFHAVLMSNITYVAAMYCWQNHEKAKLNLLIRKSIKRVRVSR
ncbi:uncharacterized protein LOC144180053 [Haemaphysalis longicornis]